MRIYRIDDESIQKVDSCFSNEEQSNQFFEDLDEFVQKMAYLAYYRKKTSDENEAVLALIKQTFFFISFCRDNIELIHQFIANFDCKQVTEEEFQGF
jgi:hypothetical protein